MKKPTKQEKRQLYLVGMAFGVGIFAILFCVHQITNAMEWMR